MLWTTFTLLANLLTLEALTTVIEPNEDILWISKEPYPGFFLFSTRIRDFDIDVLKHGCWCRNIGKDDSELDYSIKPVDELDEICYSFINQARCNLELECKGGLEFNYWTDKHFFVV